MGTEEVTGLDVLLYPHPFLFEKCDSVAEQELDTDSIRNLVEAMFQTMVSMNGAGLAASQVGINRRIIVKRNNDSTVMELINPEVVETSETFRSTQEGCLSIPGAMATVRRPESVTVDFMDMFGKEHQEEFHGLDSTIVQHEIDHLDGVLFIDRLSEFQKSKMIKRLKKKKNKTESEIKIYKSIPKK